MHLSARACWHNFGTKSLLAMNENNCHEYETVGNPEYELVENVSYSITKPGHHSNTTDCKRKCDDKKSITGEASKQANSSKVAVVLAVATCCSILLALCSVGIAAYSIAVLQTQVS